MQRYFIPINVRFFTNLHVPRHFQNLQYELRGKALVYAIRCQITNMVYVGSSLTPARRLHNHLITGKYSSDVLQNALKSYGLSCFTVYVLEVVTFPNHYSIRNKLIHLHKVEQRHINKFPKDQLYNLVSSSSTPLYGRVDWYPD